MQANPAISTPTISIKKYLPYIYQYGVYVVFLLLVIFFSFFNPRFLTVNNSLMIMQQAAPLGIAVIGMTFVLILAGIDISVGQVMYLSAILCSMILTGLRDAGYMGTVWSFAVVYLASLIIGALVGSLNGLVISRFKIVPFITTLATMGIARGIGLISSNSKVYNIPELGVISNGKLLGTNIPVIMIIFLILIFIFDFVLRRTSFGRQIMAIGNDPIAAAKIGIPVTRNIFLAYMICGSLAGLAGVLSAGQIGTVAVYFADGNEFLVISAAVLGGTSLFGGKGSVFPGALVGMLLVMTIVNGMTMMNASPYAYKIVRGAIIFLAVMVDSINYRGELR